MNLLDQLELFALRAGKATQKDYWRFVYESMKSGQLGTKNMMEHLQQKLKGLGETVDG